MFLAAVLAHHTGDTPLMQAGALALPQPAERDTPIRQSVREESRSGDTAQPNDGQ
jgi:hypothetical protein